MQHRSFLVRIILLPFVLVGALLSFVFWLLRFKPVRKFAWKQAKERVESRLHGTGKTVEGKIVGK